MRIWAICTGGQKQTGKVHFPKKKRGYSEFSAPPQGPEPVSLKKGKSTPRPARRPRLKPLPPNAPAARDEGPRLLPLAPGRDQTGLEHFLRLADIALGRKKRDRDRLP